MCKLMIDSFDFGAIVPTLGELLNACSALKKGSADPEKDAPNVGGDAAQNWIVVFEGTSSSFSLIVRMVFLRDGFETDAENNWNCWCILITYTRIRKNKKNNKNNKNNKNLHFKNQKNQKNQKKCEKGYNNSLCF